MRIAILSQKASLYSTARLVEAGQQRSHEVQVINYLHCTLDLNTRQPSILYQGQPLNANFDVVLPRIAASKTQYGTAVVRQFEAMKIASLNSSLAIARSRDKLHALQVLARAGIELPTTAFG
jgi:ribosomal protein S6--L-glutamate ligase